MKESFLRMYARLCENTEIPGIFAVWCGIFGISCTLGRRCWLDMGHYAIYPNLYLALIAESGKCRKSAAINIIERLLRQVEPKLNLISQMLTPIALIEALKTVQVDDEQKFLKESCVGYAIADELNTFINKRVYKENIGPLLTSLYDCKENFSYHTKGRGVETLSNSCLGILGGNTVLGLKESLPKETIGDGLTSRMIFVYSATVAEPIAITQRTKEQGILETDLIKFLHNILLLEGAITLTKDAWAYYQKAYDKFYRESSLYDMPTLAGYASRRHVHLLSVATVFAVSNRLTLIIDEKDISAADDLLAMSEKAMPMLLNIVTSSESGLLTQEVLAIIKKVGKISRRELLGQLYHKMDSKEFSSICETLVHSGCIKASATDKEIFLSLAT